MKNENLTIALSQILLKDPASETPVIHSGRKNMSKKQLMRRLQLLINEYQELELDIDLTPYEEAIEHLKNLKETRKYEELIQEIVDAYNPNYGVVYDQSTQEDVRKKDVVNKENQKKDKLLSQEVMESAGRKTSSL